MRWCRFRTSAGAVGYGRIDGETVAAIDGPPWSEHRDTGATHRLSEVKLLVPVIPGTFYCAGANYRDHIVKRAALKGVEPKFWPKPEIGYRANNALIADGENIVKPANAGPEFQYEGELVAVIGKRGRNVRKEDALDYVFGWTIGNDVSERGWQVEDRTNYRAKNCDTFKPMGPWIVSGVDPDAMTTTVRLNGAVVDRFKTNAMIFDTATYIAEITKYITLEPGDIMWLGTDGVPQNMQPGDTVEIEISGIGVLRNGVVAEGSAVQAQPGAR